MGLFKDLLSKQKYTLYAPMNGEKTLRGILHETGEKEFSLMRENEEVITIAKSAAAKVSTVFNW